MKTTLNLILALLFFQNAIGQSNFEKVDTYVRDTKFSSKEIDVLTKEITQPFDNELDKTRAIFIWITDNIRYDCKKFHKPKDNSFSYSSEQQRIAKIAEIREKQALRTVKYKKGVCEDYAALFSKMCTVVDIETKIITGYARQNKNEIGKAPRSANHAWNAVKLNNKWQLLDVTWASGNTDPEVKKFTKSFKEGYFLTPPESFILNHYPTDSEHQYLENPLSKEDMRQVPVIGYGYYEAGIETYLPKNAFVSSKEKKTTFQFKLNQKIPSNKIIVLMNGKKQPIEVREEDDQLLIDVNTYRKSNKKITIGFFDTSSVYYSILTYKVK